MSDKVYKLLGSHGTTERSENDFYISSDVIAEALYKCFEMSTKNAKNYNDNVVIVDSSVGTGVLLERFAKNDYDCIGYDIKDRGWQGTNIQSWLEVKKLSDTNNIIVQNPPFKLALEFVLHGLSLLKNKEFLFSLQRIQFLEGMKRYELLYGNKCKPKYVCIFSKRASCTCDVAGKGQGAMCYAWFVWQKGFKGNTQLKWIVNTDKGLAIK